jgi:DNA-binding transcriptional regulator YiaG
MRQKLARIIDQHGAPRVRERRLRIGVTQQQFARIFGVAFRADA